MSFTFISSAGRKIKRYLPFVNIWKKIASRTIHRFSTLLAVLEKITVVHCLLPMPEENQKFSTVITIAEENPPSFTVLKHCWKKIDRFSPLLALLQQNPALVALQEKNPSLCSDYWHFWKKIEIFSRLQALLEKNHNQTMLHCKFLPSLAPPCNDFHSFFNYGGSWR